MSRAIKAETGTDSKAEAWRHRRDEKGGLKRYRREGTSVEHGHREMEKPRSGRSLI